MPNCSPPCGGFADYAAIACPNPECTDMPKTGTVLTAENSTLCVCKSCGPPWRLEQPDWDKHPLALSSWMALCRTCGDKRCLGAISHLYPCGPACRCC